MLAFAILTALIASGLSGACQPLEETGNPDIASAGPRAPDPVVGSGFFWSNDRRLTNYSGEDSHPQLAVDGSGITGVTWRRDNLCMWKKIDHGGDELAVERILYNWDIPEQYGGFCAPNIGVDSNGSYHVCNDQKGTGVYYAKYDGNGTNLVPWKSVPSGASGPGYPSIAVAPDGIVNIIYEDYRFGSSAKAIVHAQLDNDGKVLRDGVRISEPSQFNLGSTLTTDQNGWVHATFVRPSIGCYHGVLDSRGDPIPDAPPVLLYKVQTYTDGPGAIACDGKGGVHILWNTGGAKAGTLMYMKLDSRGVKLSAGADGNGIPLTASPTCQGFPSIQGDSAGNAFAVWSDTRNGLPQVFFLRIPCGGENDTSLPARAWCVTKGAPASAGEPVLAIDSEGAAHLAWKDNRDGNYEIYYRLAYPYGVKASMTDKDRADLNLVHPNETRTANLTVRNTGNTTGKFHIALSGEVSGTAGWRVEVGEPELRLGAGGFRNVAVRVTGAPSFQDGDCVDVRIAATPDCYPALKSTVEFRSCLTADYSFKLNCSDPGRDLGAGENAQFILLVENTGDMDNDIALGLNGTEGWRSALDRAEVHLRPGEGQNVTLTIGSPPDAGGGDRGVFIVTGQSIQHPKTIRSVTVLSEVALGCLLEIRADKEEEYVDAGGTAVYTITLQNRGSLGGPLVVALLTEYEANDWSVVLDPDVVTLASGQSYSVRLLISPPHSAGTGSCLAVKVVCTDFDGRWSASCTTVTRFRAAHAMEVAVSPELAAVDPGGWCRFRVNLTNLGKNADSVIPGIFSTPSGLVLSYRTPDGKALQDCDAVPVGCNGTAGFDIIVSAAPDAPVGNVSIAGYVTDGGGNRYPLELKVRVNQRHDVSLLSASAAQKGSPGRNVSFPLFVKNAGNGPERVIFVFAGLPDGWPRPRICDADGMRLDGMSLNASETIRLTVTVQVPVTVLQDVVWFNLTAAAGNGTISTVQLLVTLEKPDLVVSEIKLSKTEIRVHRSVKLNVRVDNVGDADAENVTLAYSLIGMHRNFLRIGTLMAGEARFESVNWTPEEGKNVLEFVIDPDGRICEKNESNNRAILIRDVNYVAPEILPGGSITLQAVEVLAVLAIILAAIWRWRRYRKVHEPPYRVRPDGPG